MIKVIKHKEISIFYSFVFHSMFEKKLISVIIMVILITVCKLPMGVENHLIVKDQQLSASSSKDMFTGPERARLYGDKDGSFAGAWVPRYIQTTYFLTQL
jgi:hypothetical protein